MSRLCEAGAGATLDSMKVFVQSIMVFFGTLLAAGLVALGEPASAEVRMLAAAPEVDTAIVSLLGLDE